MIIGILSDTHTDKANAIPHIVKEFKRRYVEVIFHCGDIEPIHLDPKLFGNLPRRTTNRKSSGWPSRQRST